MITVVYDNNPGEEGLVADWGFSCVVRGFARTILFDTGTRGDVLLHNMGKLGILPSEIGIVVLSHIDYDHTGGLADFLGKAGKVTVFMPAVFPEDFKDGVRRAGATVVETKKAQEVCAGTSTTGVLSGVRDEQALVLDTAEGGVLVTGCAHPGVVNLARDAKAHTARPLCAALGGFHMGGFGTREIRAVTDELRELGVERIGPCHCSGERTREVMRKLLGDNYLEIEVGAHLTFPPANT